MAFPPTGMDWLLTVLCAFGGAMAASSGVGGGVLFVPLIMVIAKLPVTYASPISNFVIAISAVSTFLIHLFDTHPKDRTRPLLNFEALIYFVPIAVSSTSLGVMMSKALPEWLVTIMLFLFLVFAAYRMLTRCAKTYRQEKLENEQQQLRQQGRLRTNPLRDPHHKEEMRSMDSLGGSEASLSNLSVRSTESRDTDHLLSGRQSSHQGSLHLLTDDQSQSHQGGRGTNGTDKKERRQGEGEAAQRRSEGGEGKRSGESSPTRSSSDVTIEIEIGVMNGLKRDPSFDNLQKSERVFKGGKAGKKKKKKNALGDGRGGHGGAVVPSPSGPAAAASATAADQDQEEEEEEEQSLAEKFCVSVRSTKWWYWVLIFGSWGFQVYMSILQKETKNCSPADFALLCAQPITGLVVGLGVAHLLIGRHHQEKEKEAQQQQQQQQRLAGGAATAGGAAMAAAMPKKKRNLEGDVVLGETWRGMLKMMGVCLSIGAMGGLLGVGGGSILAPMLLELGASAVVSAPISSSLVLFSSSQAAVQYYISGKLLWNYAMWIGLVNLLANYFGLYAVKRIVKKLGYTSFIIGSLGVLLVLAAGFTFASLVGDLLKDGFTPFPKYCRSDS